MSLCPRWGLPRSRVPSGSGSVRGQCGTRSSSRTPVCWGVRRGCEFRPPLRLLRSVVHRSRRTGTLHPKGRSQTHYLCLLEMAVWVERGERSLRSVRDVPSLSPLQSRPTVVPVGPNGVWSGLGGCRPSVSPGPYTR